MENIKDFFKTYKYAIKWTICYIAVVFFILFFLFEFNLFSGRDWQILFKSRLHGFPGFVFGILLLASVPMYLATTTVIVRTKKPLFALTTAKKNDSDKTDQPADEAKPEPAIPLPADIPSELRGAFLRARQNMSNRPESVFDIKDLYTNDAATRVTQSAAQPEPEAALPIPDSFDFSTPESSAASAPVFKEIRFDDSGDDPDTGSALESAAGTPLTRHLDSRNYDYVVKGEVTVTNGLAIATHDDSDFWIADEEDWFAAGKQKHSPVSQAVVAAAEYGVSPAIYLAEKNIMDLDSKISEWESRGITVFTSLSDI
jgi:hypothetical protein